MRHCKRLLARSVQNSHHVLADCTHFRVVHRRHAWQGWPPNVQLEQTATIGVVIGVRYLVVANQTLGGERLREKLREIAGPDTFAHLVVPATPANLSVDVEFSAMDDATAAQEGRSRAQQRLRQGLAMIKNQGIDASGEVGHPDPMEAIADAMAGGDYDEIILSTLPGGISRWIKMDLPSRAGRRFELPVTHIEAST